MTSKWNCPISSIAELLETFWYLVHLMLKLNYFHLCVSKCFLEFGVYILSLCHMYLDVVTWEQKGHCYLWPPQSSHDFGIYGTLLSAIETEAKTTVPTKKSILLFSLRGSEFWGCGEFNDAGGNRSDPPKMLKKRSVGFWVKCEWDKFNECFLGGRGGGGWISSAWKLFQIATWLFRRSGIVKI